MLKKICLLMLLCALFAVIVSGCQTVSGVGGDIKWTADSTANLLEGN